MITFNLFHGFKLHGSPYFVNQPRSVGGALAEIVQVFSGNIYYRAWIEEIVMDETSTAIKAVKIGSYGMAGEKWIRVYEGKTDELAPLAQVCYWFYKATGNASDKYKADVLSHEEHPAASAV